MPRVIIRNYQVFRLTPLSATTVDLTAYPALPESVLLNDEWSIDGGYLMTKKGSARFYGKGQDRKVRGLRPRPC